MVIIEQSIPVIPEIPPMHTKIWHKKKISNLGDAETSIPYLKVMLECHRLCSESSENSRDMELKVWEEDENGSKIANDTFLPDDRNFQIGRYGKYPPAVIQ
ncbi:hypothetical protein K0M31_019718 [Melipona bicolor]|uniref:Uncharacterized protein n=1 Tax=Melipona bicolor TaxID=60889 RepID=A0AA40KRC5_9HYME|nr:hypothetical protein K0M31_019718 [Melipona bicolor]